MSEDRDVSVLIAGGGLGGLATALALAQVGHQVTVVEQAPQFDEVGAGIQLAPNATRVLQRLGVLEQVSAHAVQPARLLMMDAVDGEPLTSLDLGDEFQERYAAPYLVMHRHDLHSVLLERCRGDASIVLESDCRVTGFQHEPGGVRVQFAGGASRHAAALVAADGLNSVVRARLCDDGPLSDGSVAYRGPVAIERVNGSAMMDTVVVWVGPGLHLVQYPLRRGELYNQVAVFHSDRFDAGHDDWGTPEELRGRFSGMCEPVARSLPLLDQSMRWPMLERHPIDTWTDGPVVLIGDAAHPMYQYLAQGACQALEDAVQLAEDLPAGRDFTDGFSDFAAARTARTAAVQTTARQWGELWHLDGVARDVRNRYLRGRSDTDFSDTDWLYAGGPVPTGGVPVPPTPIVTSTTALGGIAR